MAYRVIRYAGTGGSPGGRNGVTSNQYDTSVVQGATGYALTPSVSNGTYGTGGGFSRSNDNRDIYYIQTGGSGGIQVVTVNVTPGETLTITVGSGGAGAGDSGYQAGNAGAVSIWY